MRASATFEASEQKAFVQILRYLVAKTVSGRDRVQAEIARLGLVGPN